MSGRLAALAAAVIATDTFTKLVTSQPDGMYHRPPARDTLLGLAAVGLVAPFARHHRYQEAVAVVIAGATSNLAWMAATGGGPNPLVLVLSRDTAAAFNIADVAVALGAAWVAGIVVADGWRRISGRASDPLHRPGR